jgi:hypothetical protein
MMVYEFLRKAAGRQNPLPRRRKGLIYAQAHVLRQIATRFSGQAHGSYGETRWLMDSRCELDRKSF